MAIYGGFALPSALAENTPVYKLTRTAFSQTDAELLATIDSPADGAIAIIDTVVSGKTYGKTSFMYSDTEGDWVALVGNVDAEKVILRGDITLAGNYSQVGNLTKTQTGTATFATDGMSVANALKEILSKREQPTITANPSIGNVTISPTGAVEAGTVVNNVTGSKVTFDDGSYTYEATTGVAVTSREVDRVTVPATYNADVSVSDDGSFTDAPALTIGDQGGDNVVSRLLPIAMVMLLRITSVTLLIPRLRSLVALSLRLLLLSLLSVSTSMVLLPLRRTLSLAMISVL